ncbi:MAG TPA: hypothetical protein VH143_17380 [Kofleriaceae bacterium]|nr:hypothetical protein [Kofleriaceae bacterium]
MRHVLVGILITACGSTAPIPNATPRNASIATGSAGAVVAMGSAAGSAAIVPEVGCPNPTCAFHAGAGSYFTCLSGGAGICFHFGAPCAPADGCMFDPQTGSYHTCAKAVEGACAQWTGNACMPANACLFDAADGLHHHCDQVTGGACAKYGALCAP